MKLQMKQDTLQETQQTKDIRDYIKIECQQNG